MSCDDKKHTHHHECKEEHEHKEEHHHPMPCMPMPKPCMPMPMPMPMQPKPTVVYHYHFFVNAPISIPPVPTPPIPVPPTPVPPVPIPPIPVPPTPVPPPTPTCRWYTVRPGDTMWRIAQANNISLSVLIAANPQIPNPDLIFPGQLICIPLGTVVAPIGEMPMPLPTPAMPLPMPTPLPAPTPMPLPMPPLPTPAPMPLPMPSPLPAPIPMPLPMPSPVATSPVAMPPAPVPPIPGIEPAIPGMEPALPMPGMDLPGIPDVVAGVTTGPCTWYVVKAGDTMYKIAKANNIQLSTLIAANPQIANPNMIMIGQQICIPGEGPTPSPICEQTYVIKQGDTLFKVAKQFNIPLETLIAANPQITNPDLVFVGQEICIPGAMMG